MKLEEQPDCECCWVPTTTVHHLSYERRWSEREDDIVSICEKCHYECHHVNWYQIKNDEEIINYIKLNIDNEAIKNIIAIE